jgi:hypothetical protein
MMPGMPERRSHEYARHGVATMKPSHQHKQAYCN